MKIGVTFSLMQTMQFAIRASHPQDYSLQDKKVTHNPVWEINTSRLLVLKEDCQLHKSKASRQSFTQKKSWIHNSPSGQATLFPRVQVYIFSPLLLMPLVLINVASDSFPCVYSYPNRLNLSIFLHTKKRITHTNPNIKIKKDLDIQMVFLAMVR